MLFDPELSLEKIQSMAKKLKSLHFFLLNKGIILPSEFQKNLKNHSITLLIIKVVLKLLFS